MKRLRFDAVKAGYIFEWKSNYYIKSAGYVQMLANHTSYSGNAICKDGTLIKFLPYEEVTEIGPFTQEKKHVVSKR